jgi:hypothetical protein
MTQLIEELAKIDTRFWEDISKNLTDAIDSAEADGEYRLAAEIYDILDDWSESFAAAKAARVFDRGVCPNLVSIEERMRADAARVRGQLDTLIANLVRKQVA